MLFLIELDTDSGALAQAPAADIKALVQKEWDWGLNAYRSGKMLRIWFKASGGGAVGIFDFASHDELHQAMRALPFFRYFSDIRVTPLVGHPLYPHFDRPDADAASYAPPTK